MIIEDFKIWLFTSELIQYGISEGVIKNAIMRNRSGQTPSLWINKPYDFDNRKKLIDYDSLPPISKSKLPLREDLLKLHKDISLVDLHRDFCTTEDYHFFQSRVLDKDKALDLKHAAGWLRFLNEYRSSSQTRKISFATKSELRKAVVDTLIDNAKKKKGVHLYGFKITNPVVLQRKELAWSNAMDKAFDEYAEKSTIEAQKFAIEAALSTLIHDNFNNNNRRKVGKVSEAEEEQILLPSGKIDFSEWNAKTILWLYQNPGRANKYDFENLYRRYELECKKQNRMVTLALRTVKHFLTSDEVKLYTTRERSGWAEYDKMLPHTYGKRPEFSLSKGGYDGLQVDFYSKVEGKQFMFTVVAVFDYMSEAITGFDVGMVEDGNMVRTMYRNHLNLCGGRSYVEIESDRFSGNLAEETRTIFEKTCRYITQPAPNDPQKKASNPKARFVERLIQELNRLTQNFEGWKGTNISSIDRNRKPNPDYRNGNYVEGYAESMKQIIDLIAIYNNDKHGRSKSRMETFLANMNPEAPQISRENISQLLNQSTIVKVEHGAIKFIANRKVYEYDFSDFDQYVHKMIKRNRVKVYYDETDMSTVDVFGEGDSYITTLSKIKRSVRAKAEQTEEDVKELGKQSSRRAATNERITRKSLEAEASIYGIDISGLSIDDALAMVLGARETTGEEMHITPHELFEEALNTPTAKLEQGYYEDRLIRSQGEMVPVIETKEDQKTNRQKMIDLHRKKFSNNQNQ